uniref:C-type lectin domain-containing protein n=1 Tax=Acrobeloides nanus TaxID=290746 RepID=A0A914CAM6_9BILA
MCNITFFKFIFSLLIITQSLAACPNWTTSYNGTEKCYLFTSTKINIAWYNAEASCNCIGGHLATIDNAYENVFIAKNTNASVWVGAYQVYINTIYWEWTADRRVTYSNWYNPNSSYMVSYVQNGKWFQTGPEDNINNYACEIPQDGIRCPKAQLINNNIIFWTYYNSANTCYHNTLYIANADTFANTATKCDNLLSIHSAQESDALSSYLYSSLAYLNYQEYIWVGIYDPYKNGSWVWFDGSPLNYTNWDEDEPQHGNDCATFTSRFVNSIYQWASIPCSSQGIAICKSPASVQKDQTFPEICNQL